ncbi:MAG: hypothetical protein OEU92_32475 [Alphaproteobacteria bacterium]|nr:hypothetical protein [Alphaproteobacteria bacterium]
MASLKPDDDAWAGCKMTLRVPLSMATTSSLGPCDAPHRGAPSSSHLPTDKGMKSLENFQSGLLDQK